MTVRQSGNADRHTVLQSYRHNSVWSGDMTCLAGRQGVRHEGPDALGGLRYVLARISSSLGSKIRAKNIP